MYVLFVICILWCLIAQLRFAGNEVAEVEVLAGTVIMMVLIDLRLSRTSLSWLIEDRDEKARRARAYRLAMNASESYRRVGQTIMAGT
jgi:hypothetical protein